MKTPAMKTPAMTGRSAALYLAAFITGAIIMSFEMLGSRYLNPYFGSGIYTWAALISTVLAAMSAGYFYGGWLADRRPQARILGALIVTGSLYLAVLPLFADAILQAVLANIDDIRLGSLVSAFIIMFFPVVFLGMFSPFAIRLLLTSAEQSGSVSGTVYGISTFGSIMGTWGTTFFLMPEFGARAITIGIGVAGAMTGMMLMALPQITLKSLRAPGAAIALLMAGLFTFPPSISNANDFLDPQTRAATLKLRDGAIAHRESEYNDIFIARRGPYLAMTFKRFQQQYTESVSNLDDPDELPLGYTQTMMLGAIYPDELRKALMIGLGGGSMPVYLARHLPDLHIDNVELDPGVIKAAKDYFGLRETPKMRLIENDGRVFLIRNATPYDLIMVDAFRGGYVPFHLLTREFYTLLKQRLAPKGVAVFNIHPGTKLYDSTLVTLKSVFATVDLYKGEGSVIAIASAEAPMPPDVLAQRAAAAQARHNFRYPPQTLLATRTAWPDGLKAALLTDDFAPVSLYDVTKQNNRRQW